YLVLPVKLTVSIIAIWPSRPPLISVGSQADAELLRLMPSAVMSSLLVVLALIPAIRDLESDLLEWRRRLRIVHILGVGSVIIVVILARLLFRGPDLGAFFAPISVTLAFATTVAFALTTMRFRDGLFNEKESAAPEAEIDHVLREKLELAFQKERLYA